jgi:hypothetical protein
VNVMKRENENGRDNDYLCLSEYQSLRGLELYREEHQVYELNVRDEDVGLGRVH